MRAAIAFFILSQLLFSLACLINEPVGTSTYYEGGSTLVYAFDGKTLTEVGSNGCGA